MSSSRQLASRLRRPAMAALLGLPLALVLPAPGRAQGDLLQIPDKVLPVSYSPGSLDRAAHLQQRLAPLVQLVTRWAGGRAPFPVYVLSRDDWEAAAVGGTYGLPAPFAGGLALPAVGDAATVDLWQRLAGDALPPVVEDPVRGSSAEAAGLLAADLLAEAEGTRLLLAADGYSGEQPWVADVLAHTAARSAASRLGGAELAALDRLYAALGAGRSTPLPLAAYSGRPPLEDWLWFQAQFARAAAVACTRDGKKAGRRLLDVAHDAHGRLSVGDLVREIPDLGGWLTTSFAH